MKDDRVYLLHVRDAIRKIRAYTADGEATFLADERTQDAVIRNLQVIDEAVKRISPAFTEQHPDIPWKRIAGMRDKMIHDYLGVNLQIVWQTVTVHLPVLDRQIGEFISPEE